jgi:hypothetical protein
MLPSSFSVYFVHHTTFFLFQPYNSGQKAAFRAALVAAGLDGWYTPFIIDPHGLMVFLCKQRELAQGHPCAVLPMGRTELAAETVRTEEDTLV